MEFPEQTENIFSRVCFECGGVFWCFDWPVVVLVPSIAGSFPIHAAHRRSRLPEAAAAAEDASLVAVQVESSYTI